MTTLWLGPLLTASAMALAFGIEHRDLRAVAIAFPIGGSFGLLLFGPIVAAEMFRGQLLHWLHRQWNRIHRYFAFAMAISLGYLMACSHYKVCDAFTFVAAATVFVGAMVGTFVGVAFKGGPDRAA